MDFRQIRAFLLVSELGSINQASSRLNIAQPALSRQIKLLESAMGRPLFERCSNGMRLTKAGRGFLESIADPFRNLEETFENARASFTDVSRQVRIGISPSVSCVLSKRLTRAVATRLPGVSLSLFEAYSEELGQAVKSHDIDAAIIQEPRIICDRIIRANILREPLLLVGPPGSRLDMAEPLQFSDLQTFPLILPTRRHRIRSMVEEAASELGIDLDVRYELNSLSSMKEMVESGEGYAVLTPSSVFRERSERRLRCALIASPSLYRRVVILHSADRLLNHHARSVMNIMKKEASEAVKSGDWLAEIEI